MGRFQSYPLPEDPLDEDDSLYSKDSRRVALCGWFLVPTANQQALQKLLLDNGVTTLSEYDFSRDSKADHVPMALRRASSLRPYQDRCLSRMFAQGCTMKSDSGELMWQASAVRHHCAAVRCWEDAGRRCCCGYDSQIDAGGVQFSVRVAPCWCGRVTGAALRHGSGQTNSSCGRHLTRRTSPCSCQATIPRNRAR